MTRDLILSLPVAALLVGAAFSQGNPADPQQDSQPPSVRAVDLLYERAFVAQTNAALLQTARRESQRRMNVDIEVFRRLLDEKAQQLRSPVFWHGKYGAVATPGGVIYGDSDGDGQVDLSLPRAYPSGQASGSLAFSPDGILLYAESDDGMQALDAATGKMYRSTAAASTAAPARAFEGVYLSDYGILFTATLPFGRVVFDPHSGRDVFDRNQCASCHVDPTAVVPRAEPRPTRWEQLRRELSGESAATDEKNGKEVLVRETKTLPAAPPSREEEARTLAVALAKVLAENGRHLSELGDEERVVLAITLQAPPAPSIRKRSNLTYQDFYGYGARQPDAVDAPMPASPPAAADGEDAADPNDPADSEAPEQVLLSTAAPAEAPSTVLQALGRFYESSDLVANRAPSTAREYVLLGDLHVKQGKTQSALQAYSDAAAVLGEAVQITIDKDATAEEARAKLEEAQQQIVQLYAKLAHVQALLGRHQEARATMQQVAEGLARLKVRVGEEIVDVTVNDATEKVLGAAKKSAARLPAKLIISAPKSLLMEVGEGKISLEEFQKQVTIEVRGLDKNEAAAEEPAPAGGR